MQNVQPRNIIYGVFHFKLFCMFMPKQLKTEASSIKMSSRYNFGGVKNRCSISNFVFMFIKFYNLRGKICFLLLL